MRFLAIAMLVTSFVLWAAPAAHADTLETIAYEGFDYTANDSLDGLNGGSGWSGAWAYPQGADSPLAVSSSALTYPGLSVNGLSSSFRGLTGRVVNGSGRDLPLVSEGMVYVRFLATFSGSFGGGTPNFRFYDSSSGWTGGIGNNGALTAAILTAGLTAATPSGDSGVSMYSGATRLLVVRIDYSASQTDMWVDPDLSTFDYFNPPAADATATSLAPTFDRIYLYNKNSGSFDEITIMRVVSESSPQGSSSSATPTRTLSLAASDDVSCSQSRVRGSLGGWVELPAADQCSVEVNLSEQVLGWASQPDFPVDIARRQVDNGWGAYELTNEEGEITAVFIPAGGATLLSGSTQLYPILG